MALSKSNVNRIIFVLLIALLIVGVVYFMRLNNNMQSLQNSLSESKQERMRLQASLNRSQSLIEGQKTQFSALSQEKQTLLSEHQALQAEIDGLNVRLLQLQELLNKESQEKQALENDKKALHKQIFSLQDELRLWEGKINSLKEADTLKQKQRKSRKLLRKNIRVLHVKIQKEKQRIEKEIERLRLEAGNRGYILQNGESTYVPDSAVELDRIIIRSSSQQ